MVKSVLAALAVIACTLPTRAAVKVSVDASKVRCEIPPRLYGTGMEDVNHEIYGGLDAQRLYASFSRKTATTTDSTARLPMR